MPDCRICFEDTGKLVSPCNCTGTIGYVHLECLGKWINLSGQRNCKICFARFRVKEKINNPNTGIGIRASFYLITFTFVLLCYITIGSRESIFIWPTMAMGILWTCALIIKTDHNNKNKTKFILEEDHGIDV